MVWGLIMDILYIVIIALALHAFLSEKINTEAVLKKFWILFIILGSLIDFSQLDKVNPIPNYFIEIGLLFYFVSNIIRAYFHKLDRRASDRATQ
jgi:hypothetical protein